MAKDIAYQAKLSIANPSLITAMKKFTYKLSLLFLLQLSLANNVYAQTSSSTSSPPLQFNRYFLHNLPNQEAIDLNLFNEKNNALPGQYLVDIYINQTYIGQTEVRIDTSQKTADDTPKTAPCITASLLEQWQVNLTKLPPLPTGNTCIDVEQLIPYSKITFNNNQQKLEVSLPQTILKRERKGGVDQHLWDNGITAGLLNYQLTASRYHSSTQTDSHNMGLNLQGGINFDAWRLRYRTYYQNKEGQSSWQTSNINVSRDLSNWRSRLTLGDTFTSANILEGISLRGVQITSADDMLPDTLRSYAPIIQGIAQSQAQVTIKQNGYVMYTTFVAPGPFVIDDLSPLLSSGELAIIITEANGRTTTSYQSFAAAPMQIRSGNLQYEIATGKYRNTRDAYAPNVAQATLLYGVNNSLSTYGGLRLSNDYQSAIIGAGLSLGQYGASSLDITHSSAHLSAMSNQISQGQTLRWQYTKSFPKAETYLQITLNQYFASFYTFNDAINFSDRINETASLRTRLDSTLIQNLGKNYGRISATLGMNRYQDQRKLHNIRLSYNNKFKDLSYSLDYNYSQTPTQKFTTPNQHQLTVSLSLPLGGKAADIPPIWFNYSLNTDNRGLISHNASVGGSLMEENQLTYNAGVSYSNSTDKNGFVSANLQTKWAQLVLGHTQGQDYGNTNMSINGGAIFHAGGITLSQPLQDTVILAQIPDTPELGFENYTNVVTDAHGYAVIPYAMPYRRNKVTLKTDDLRDDIEVENAIIQAVPTRGAIVLAKYAAKRGYKLLLSAHFADGRALPFGAYVQDQQGHQISMVGPGSQIFLSGITPTDNFSIEWGKDQQQQCHLSAPLSKVWRDEGVDSAHIPNKLFEGKVLCN